MLIFYCKPKKTYTKSTMVGLSSESPLWTMNKIGLIISEKPPQNLQKEGIGEGKIGISGKGNLQNLTIITIDKFKSSCRCCSNAYKFLRFRIEPNTIAQKWDHLQIQTTQRDVANRFLWWINMWIHWNTTSHRLIESIGNKNEPRKSHYEASYVKPNDQNFTFLNIHRWEKGVPQDPFHIALSNHLGSLLFNPIIPTIAGKMISSYAQLCQKFPFIVLSL